MAKKKRVYVTSTDATKVHLQAPTAKHVPGHDGVTYCNRPIVTNIWKRLPNSGKKPICGQCVKKEAEG